MENMDNPFPDQNKRRLIAAKVSEAFRKEGFRPIQYGGATTGDVDIGFLDTAPSQDVRARVMASLGCERGQRLFILDGVVLDLGGVASIYSKNFVEIQTPAGSILMESVEESLIQRILSGVYPQVLQEQIDAAKLIIAQGLAGNLNIDWNEVKRIAEMPGFKVGANFEALYKEVELELAQQTKTK
jgi:hypothetical protein